MKTTINIKKENIISAGRVINMDKLVNKDFYNIIKSRVYVKHRNTFLDNLLGNPGLSKIKQIYMDWFLKFCQKTNKKYLDGNYYNLLFQPNHICSNGKYQLTVYVMFVK